MAAPSLPSAAANPKAELAGASSKVKQAAEKVGDALPEARKGALAPDVEGQRRKYSSASGAACSIGSYAAVWQVFAGLNESCLLCVPYT
jgi:hypothetical protein